MDKNLTFVRWWRSKLQLTPVTRSHILMLSRGLDRGDPLIFGSMNTSTYVLKNAQSKLASVVLESILGPTGLAPHTLQCPCLSVVTEATHDERLRAHEWRHVRSKTLFKGSCWEEQENVVFSRWGVLDLMPYRQLNELYLSATPNIWVLATALSVVAHQTTSKASKEAGSPNFIF